MAPTSTPTRPAAPPPAYRMAGGLGEMTRLIRLLFEVEREFVRTLPTLIYRVGEPELKYLLCQHVWESAGHARFLRERGRELHGLRHDRDGARQSPEDFQRGCQHERRQSARRHRWFLRGAETRAARGLPPLSQGPPIPSPTGPRRNSSRSSSPTRSGHLREIAPYLKGVDAREWKLHLTQALDDLGGWLGQEARLPLGAAGYVWQNEETRLRRTRHLRAAAKPSALLPGCSALTRRRTRSCARGSPIPRPTPASSASWSTCG